MAEIQRSLTPNHFSRIDIGQLFIPRIHRNTPDKFTVMQKVDQDHARMIMKYGYENNAGMNSLRVYSDHHVIYTIPITLEELF